MKKSEIDELLQTDGPLEPVTLDLDLIRKNLPQYTSQKLSEMIVADRYLSFNKEMGVMCMEELARRRAAGDPFEFEKYIDDAFNSLPKLDFKLSDIRSVLQQAIGRKSTK
jgi:hypothetical protein